MDDQPLRVGDRYLVRVGGQAAEGVLERIVRRVNIGTYESVDDIRPLRLNEVGSVVVSLSKALVVAPLREDRRAGALILVDPVSGNTVAAGGAQ
jgi:sulfate adenylyltransferase subunit 1 (EFTu-like GTPase family)